MRRSNLNDIFFLSLQLLFAYIKDSPSKKGRRLPSSISVYWIFALFVSRENCDCVGRPKASKGTTDFGDERFGRRVVSLTQYSKTKEAGLLEVNGGGWGGW